jgi:hypothetical protein
MSLKTKFNELVSNFGKREWLVYIVVSLWIAFGILGAFEDANFAQMATYFGSLTAYVATYIWAETKRPSEKTSVMLPGPSSRREIMIYLIVVLWAIAGAIAIKMHRDLGDLALYFVSLTGFVASWIAGEVYKPEDTIKLKRYDKENTEL